MARRLAIPTEVIYDFGHMLTGDPLTAARIRGEARKASILEAAGGTLSAEEVANMLCISREALEKCHLDGRLIAITAKGGSCVYPGFQFKGRKIIQGLELVLNALSHVDPWMQLVYLTTPSERLGLKTPIVALQFGMVDEVVGEACIFGEQGVR